MAKLVKLFLIFGPVHGTIKVIKKYANPGQTIDESLMSTLCLPGIELVNEPEAPKFQTFLVTKEDGQVLYGSGLIVHERHHEPPPYPGAGRFASYCYTIITDAPFINATRSLLQLIWEKKCDDIIIRSVMNIPVPARRHCLRIVAPSTMSNVVTTTTATNNLVNNNRFPLIFNNNTLPSPPQFEKCSNPVDDSHTNQQSSQKSCPTKTDRTIDDIYLYRMTDLPLLDYPLRELFSFIHVDDFLLAYACILMEFRTLIISKDNYKLMMVGETLTSLLLPLKWCNVYVPILPPVYGATYLDAPTSYIMGINTQVTELPDNLNHIQCRIYCDESRVVCDVDSLALPLFLNEIKQNIIQITLEYQALHSSRPFTYLDDLKFNRAIRILFIKTIRKNILSNYERYIMDVPESSSDIRQFDVVSYLSDQPEFMRSFLSKFLDTQLFASFIDENAKRIQQSFLSIFDMEPEELSEHFSDKTIEQAFQKAQRVHLMDLREEHVDIEVKNVPASPMKIRRRVPALSAIASRLSFASRSTSNAASIDHGTSNANSQPITSTPPIHRNSVATVCYRGLMSLSPNSTDSIFRQKKDTAPNSLKTNPSTNQPVPNGKITELLDEVKDLTKSILVERFGTHEPIDSHVNLTNTKHRIESSSQETDNNLIGALCDLIERVWAHGAFPMHQDHDLVQCPLWNHLLAFTRLKYLDSRPNKHEFSDGSHLNVLSPSKVEATELDKIVMQHSNPFGPLNWFKSNKFERADPMRDLIRDLIRDLNTIHTLKDVKTDVGKARAFIKYSLEHKKLSEHLKTLLGDQTLLSTLYKPYAFLRCEEEREQFLMYLSTLNAVDLPCYTSTFVSVISTRRMGTAA